MEALRPSTAHLLSLCGSDVRYWIFNPDKPQTILMLHGFSGNHKGLAKIIDELDDYRLIVPDLPGFGYSSPMTSYPHTIAGYSHFVEQFINALRFKTPPILLGHSLGSVVGARLAATRPQLIDHRLILLSPISTSPFSAASPRHLAARLGEMHYWLGLKVPTVGPKLVNSHTISRVTTFALTKTPNKQLRRAIYQHHIEDLEFLKNRDVFFEAYQSLNRDGIVNYAPRITQKTLLIAGAADEMWPKRTQQKVQKLLQNSKLILLPKVGHLTHFEAPATIVHEIKTFLRT